MPTDQPRYAVYDLEIVKSDGRHESKLLFVMYSPDNCTVGPLRVMYTTHKGTVKSKISPVYKELQINDHSDIKESEWISDLS